MTSKKRLEKRRQQRKEARRREREESKQPVYTQEQIDSALAGILFSRGIPGADALGEQQFEDWRNQGADDKDGFPITPFFRVAKLPEWIKGYLDFHMGFGMLGERIVLVSEADALHLLEWAQQNHIENPEPSLMYLYYFEVPAPRHTYFMQDKNGNSVHITRENIDAWKI